MNNPLTQNSANNMNSETMLKNDMMNPINSIIPTATNIVNNTNQTLEQFGNNASVALTETQEMGQSFLQSNTIIAKFVFVILVVIVFIFLLNLGITWMGYFLQPTNNPYLLKGMTNGSTFYHISRDPKQANSVTLLHSNNQASGMEFTWSFWLYISPFANSSSDTKTYNTIFVVGNGNYDNTGISTVLNGPGVYLQNASGTATMHIVMDVIPNQLVTNQIIDVTNLPFNKWMHVAMRMENTMLDVYINGVITTRTNFTNLPKQNYGDVYINDNGGFNGSLSNLQYYNRALDVFSINGIVGSGPNLSGAIVSSSSSSTPTTSTSSGASYLSSQWYINKLF